MSLTGPGVSGLPLFAEPAPPAVQQVHDRFEQAEAPFLDRVRRLIAGHYAGSDRTISTDEAHHIMARYGIRVPDGVSANVMGSLFSAWDRAEAVGWTRSKREGTNGNLLRTWRISR